MILSWRCNLRRYNIKLNPSLLWIMKNRKKEEKIYTIEKSEMRKFILAYTLMGFGHISKHEPSHWKLRGFHEYHIRRVVLYIVLKADTWFEHTI